MKRSLHDLNAAIAAGASAALAVAYGALWVVFALVVMVPVLLGVVPDLTESMRALAHVTTLGVENDGAMMAVFVMEIIWVPALIHGCGIGLRTWSTRRGWQWSGWLQSRGDMATDEAQG
jgi:hypothetical protein